MDDCFEQFVGTVIRRLGEIERDCAAVDAQVGFLFAPLFCLAVGEVSEYFAAVKGVAHVLVGTSDYRADFLGAKPLLPLGKKSRKILCIFKFALKLFVFLHFYLLNMCFLFYYMSINVYL